LTHTHTLQTFCHDLATVGSQFYFFGVLTLSFAEGFGKKHKDHLSKLEKLHSSSLKDLKAATIIWFKMLKS